MRHPDPSVAIPTLSIVVPAYNEAEVLPLLHRRLCSVMDGVGESWELVLVNDGSRDGTLAAMQALRRLDPRVGVVNLSRNFGKEIALTAGLDHARGEAVIVIDADLQDPPELIPALVAGWREGFDTVYAQRRQREGETWLKKATAAGFYRLMQRLSGVQLPPDTGDFRLMSRRVVDALSQLREHHRFMKGLFAWVGFPSKAVLYDRAPREAGTTKWNYWKLWNFALEGITSFTVMPLKLATYLGLAIGLFAGVYLVVVVAKTLLVGSSVAGYPSLMAVVLFMGGAQLVTLGVMGEYLGRVFNESKQRPLYFVERFEPPEEEDEEDEDEEDRRRSVG
ncbi:MAG: glycosyltransferase family 2 protein [Rhodospirillales bacterium]|nr:glycosyltransferase family 2 protein [Rhodospirillales bacterium]MBN8898540.1 glycosyltransferase family 2 protein [Rhodospirillales bacterium]